MRAKMKAPGKPEATIRYDKMYTNRERVCRKQMKKIKKHGSTSCAVAAGQRSQVAKDYEYTNIVIDEERIFVPPSE